MVPDPYDAMDASVLPWLPPPMRHVEIPDIPVEKYGSWHWSGWQQAPQESGMFNVLTWSCWATSAKTGEQVTLQYFSPARMDYQGNGGSEVKQVEQIKILQEEAEDQAMDVMRDMVEEAVLGTGYVVGANVEGYVYQEVNSVLAEMLQGLMVLPQERFDELQNVVAIAITQGIDQWQNALQKIRMLGGALDKQSGKGVPIPIQPIQPNQE